MVKNAVVDILAGDDSKTNQCYHGIGYFKCLSLNVHLCTEYLEVERANLEKDLRIRQSELDGLRERLFGLAGALPQQTQHGQVTPHDGVRVVLHSWQIDGGREREGEDQRIEE